MRRFWLAATLCISSLGSLGAQTPPTEPLTTDTATFPFDLVTTVKLHKGSDQGMSISGRDDTWEAHNVTLQLLLVNAFDVRDDMVFNLPPWASSTSYDITIKALAPSADALKKLTKEQRRSRLILMLKDRFNLKAHLEMRPSSVYELTVLPSGVKMKPSAPITPLPDGSIPKGSHGMSMSSSESESTVKATGMSMSAFANTLSHSLDRFVIDKTKLTGDYDFELRWSSEQALQQDNGSTEHPPAIFTALQEELGVKLVPAKGLVPAVVVDQVSEPQPD